MKLPALSIWQPWAHAIVHLGKNIENRDWRFPPRYRGPILIHASCRRVQDDIDANLGVIGDILDRAFSAPPAMQFGGIIGRAELVDVVRESSSPWFFGPLGFVLQNAEPLPFYRIRGQQGFFEVDMSLPPDPEPAQRAKVARGSEPDARQRSLFR